MRQPRCIALGRRNFRLIGLVGLLPRTNRPAGTKICGRKGARGGARPRVSYPCAGPEAVGARVGWVHGPRHHHGPVHGAAVVVVAFAPQAAVGRADRPTWIFLSARAPSVRNAKISSNIFESTMGLASIEKYSTPYEILQILDYMFTDIFVFSDILIFKIFTAYEI